jgi:Icc-related predicted phosphoesterase
MKILAVSDEVVPQVYDASIKRRFADVDLVLSCGDLPHYYLEYIVTMLNVPLYHVMGNHGDELDWRAQRGEYVVPGGCQDIDGRLVVHGGLLIAGLQGSMRYKPGPYQYTQREMQYKVLRLGATLLRNRLSTGRWLDILITHAPPLGIHDGTDLCHTGFQAFVRFMDRHRPRYLLHGHSHVYSQLQTTVTHYHDTVVMNVHPYRVIDIPEIQTTEHR